MSGVGMAGEGEDAGLIGEAEEVEDPDPIPPVIGEAVETVTKPGTRENAPLGTLNHPRALAVAPGGDVVIA